MPMPGAGAMPRTTIKQFQQLRPPTFYGTPDPMAAESWLLGIERVFEVLPCTDEQKVVFATFMFEGAALIGWQLKKPLEPLWLWPRFLEVFNEEYFPEMNLARREGLKLDYDGTSRIRWKILRLPTHQEVLHAALIAEESLNEMSQFRENRKKRIEGNGSSRSNELPTCPTCQKKHWGECRMGSRGCYGCGQEGHQIRDCPMRKRIQGAGTLASASLQQPPTERGIVNHDKVELLHLYQEIPQLPHQLCQYLLNMSYQYRYPPGILCCVTESTVHVRFVSMMYPCVVPPPYLISSMKARRLIQKGSQAFLCSVVDTHVSPPTLEDIHVVREFPDVFPDEYQDPYVDGVSVDPHKVEAIVNWPRPTNVTELRGKIPFEWNEKREKSFQILKKRLVSAPILACLPTDGFTIYSDASHRGLGCVLMQHGKVIAYASRQLRRMRRIIRPMIRVSRSIRVEDLASLLVWSHM
ncbi:hypothetical protein Acr_22g0002380 [Actinidia rufa]|uniref:CCHC-type domain-containing protein n=1 Tax=Actinidia rufa TaxID=165716 RepID=A0A7J0GJ55_9ERIC|nr:hypothetical protein Acr_22g0002380 [Actinidia rufa]